MKIKNLLALLLVLSIVSCGGRKKESAEQPAPNLSGLDKANFQSIINGDSTNLYILTNSNGMEVAVTNYGGVIVSIMAPDKDGELKDVVLGFDNVQDYVNIDNDFGATIGRYANRIANGKITVDGVEYQLPQNNFGHTLHGGPKGFKTKVFDAEQLDNQTIVLKYTSEDGEEGFPGNLDLKVTMTLTNDNAVDIQYEAKTDKETVCNLTNHSYFNLSGNPENTILEDILVVDADTYTPVDDTFMTTGAIEKVEGTPMDFRAPTAIGEKINEDFEQLKNGNGYDHNWVLNAQGDVSKVSASLYSPATGIQLDVYTSEPGIQVYTGNFLDGSVKGKKGITYNSRSAICLETQKYPNSPNNPEWPSSYLKPGETYTSRCSYKFSVR